MLLPMTLIDSKTTWVLVASAVSIVPLLLVAPADAAPSPRIRLVGVLLSDNADADGIPDSNETVQVRLEVENASGFDLTDPFARQVHDFADLFESDAAAVRDV